MCHSFYEKPDIVPLESWLAPEVAEKLIKILDVDTSKGDFALAKRLGHDFLYRAVKRTVWGNVDTRRVMSHGSIMDVVNEVKNVLGTESRDVKVTRIV
ncbi:MAG: hypothetical protein AB1798_20535 [Spirochaetota bacterium]